MATFRLGDIKRFNMDGGPSIPIQSVVVSNLTIVPTTLTEQNSVHIAPELREWSIGTISQFGAGVIVATCFFRYVFSEEKSTPEDSAYFTTVQDAYDWIVERATAQIKAFL